MLDVQFIKDNKELVETKSKQKGYEVNLSQLLEMDEQRRRILTEIEALRAQRNEMSAQLKQGQPTPEQIERGKELKLKVNELEKQLEPVEVELDKQLKAVPNMPLDDVPVGSSEDENQVVKTVGDVPNFSFTPKSHGEIGEDRDLIDKKRAVKIAGSRFAYLKGGIVQLQFAIIQFVFQTLSNEQILQKLITDNGLNISAKAFVPVLPPALVKTDPYEASARLNAAEVTYKLEDDDLWLNASAEHSLCTMYWDEILAEDSLPIRYIGYSTSFRREAGTYGKDTDGIIRMHQFDKMEMEVFSTAETGRDEHLLLIAVQEYMIQQLGLPYQLIQKCTADIGKPNARGVDINTWFPSQSTYRETHTADYMTDYQARRLKTRVRRTDGSIQLVHTNDATAFALGRIMAAIIENYQTTEQKIIVPDVLRPFMAGKSEI